ncbi:sulfate permease [Calycina marina]|uniref:Sulfate permease n=1 Tax=Calycina marina TaxID=1763456 RepID=A0A9P7Z2S5_9HELO|nr:sulfate permease [Calycina marina]
MPWFNPENAVEEVKTMVKTDTTTNRAKIFVVESVPKLPSATKNYLLAKFPIIEWLPRYQPSWLITDAIAGLTIGVMLIPQGLAYAKIATIPIENGLYSSWLPAALAVFMGTSKDLSTGPTSILGLLTAQIVKDLGTEYGVTEVANAVAFMVGVYCLALGILGLGFLLDYVSVPVLTGFISATALVIGFGQVGSLVGLSNTPSNVFDIIGDVLKRLPNWDGPTCGIGFGTVLILVALEQVGKRWGSRHFFIKYLSSSRAVIALVIFTLISYLVNKDRGSDLLWAISEVDTNGILPPKAHNTKLLSKVATRAFGPLVAAALEHLAVGKAFGRRNGYSIDQTQEFNYLGITNLVNSFFGVMPVGGAMSRTAVNSECGVKSPLNGVVTSGFLVLTIYVFSPALYWLPKATLSAIIIMAVLHLFGPVSAFYKFWRVSLVDFVGSMLCFWLTIFQTAEIGIETGAGFCVAWTMLRYAFTRPTVQASTEEHVAPAPDTTARTNSIHGSRTENVGIDVPTDCVLITFHDAMFYPNVGRSKAVALEEIQLVYEKLSSLREADPSKRSWSVRLERRVERLRKERNIVPRDSHLAVVVLDFTKVSYIDMTAILALSELKQDIRLYSGAEVQFRFVGLNNSVLQRLRRSSWLLADLESWSEEGGDVIYSSLLRAVCERDIVSGELGEKKGD